MIKNATFIAALAAVSGGGPALAADLALTRPAPVARAYSWTGWYVGGNLGYDWMNDSGRPRCFEAGVENSPACQNVVPLPAVHSSGFSGGVQAGFNWQFSPNLVAGIETDFQGMSVQGSTTINGPFANFAGALQTGSTSAQFTASERSNWLGTLRGRVGVTWERLLIYATGGLAYGSVHLATNFVAPSFNFPANESVTRTGYTIGGGSEWAFANDWSAKIEGLYYSLGTTTLLAGDPTSPVFARFLRGKDFELQGAIVRLGVNYQFH